MRHLILLTASAMALAACSGDEVADGDVPADTEVVEDGVEIGEVPAQPLRPGLWELDESVGAVAEAGMRGEEESEIEADPARRGAARTVCLPADYADRPHPDFWASDRNACSYGDFAMADGALEGTLTCNATPGTLTLDFDGDYSETGFDLAMTATRSGEGQDVTVNGRLEGRWLRACDAEEATR